MHSRRTATWRAGRIIGLIHEGPPPDWKIRPCLASRGELILFRRREGDPSWLNQIEVYFSIVQRKALTPNDLDSLDAARDRLIGFQRHYEAVAKPLKWKFTRAALAQFLADLDAADKAAA